MNFENILQGNQKERFKQAANRLLTECFILKQVNETVSDYLFVQKNIELFRSYFALLGYEINVQEEYGVIGLNSGLGAGRLQLRKLDSILLLILRLLYIEGRKSITNGREIYITIEQIYSKYNMLALHEKIERKRTEIRMIMALFNRYRLLRNLDADMSDPDTRIEIYPSILLAVNSESLQATYEKSQAQLAQYATGDDIDEPAEYNADVDKDSID